MTEHMFIKETFNENSQDYLLTLGETYNNHVQNLAEQLNIKPAEVMRRSLMLFYHSFFADKTLMIKDNKTYEVLGLISL